MVKNNIYAEIRRYMKNAIIRGCTNEEVLKHRAYIYATNLVGENATRIFIQYQVFYKCDCNIDKRGMQERRRRF